MKNKLLSLSIEKDRIEEKIWELCTPLIEFLDENLKESCLHVSMPTSIKIETVGVIIPGELVTVTYTQYSYTRDPVETFSFTVPTKLVEPFDRETIIQYMKNKREYHPYKELKLNKQPVHEV